MATEYTPRANVLSAANLSTLIRRSIPTQSDPQIKSPYDAIALASHASMLAVGFRMVGLGEDHKLENTSDRDETHELPAEWNANAGTYAFRYKHEQSSMEFLLKANRMGNKVMIMGMGLGDDRTCSFDLKVQEFISEGNLPATPKKDGASDEEIEKAIVDIFINIGRLSDLGSLHRLSIIQKLAPSLQKPGYEESSEGQSSNTQQSESRDRTPRQDPLRDDRNPPARPFPLADPLAQPRRPMPEPMPGFEDELETGRPARGGLPGGGFPNIGDRDLYPQGLGPRDPLRGGVGPGFGGMGGGGMHPTFDDPMFAGQGQRGNGFDPQVPPGARFDPMGPGPRGGAGHPRGAGMGGRPPNPFGGFGDGDFL